MPGEPAGWANWGVLALRQRNYDMAAQRLERARDLAPQNDQIYDLLGILEGQRGHSAEAIADLRKAVELNPKNLRAAYALAEEIERQGDANSEAEFQQVMQKILAAQPDNLAALLELSRVAAKRGDAATLKSAVAQISARSSAWPSEVQQQLATVQAAAAGTDLRAAATRTTFLRNVLMRVPEYRQSLSVIKAPAGEEARPFTHFLRMESPVFTPAPPDMAIKFDVQPVANPGNRHWNWIGAIQLGSAGAPVIAEADGREVHLSSGATLPFPGGPSKVPPTPEGVLQVDFNYDFKTDLVLAGAGGVRLFRQDSPERIHRCDRADQVAEVRDQRPLHRRVGGRHRGRRRSRHRAGRERRIADGAAETTATARFWRFIPLLESAACADLPGPILMATAIPMPPSSTARAGFMSS